ncbi:MAG TPA: NAD-dependent protein deacylase [Geminicoccaceae bacterium]|nr:NAD-dependent protein deacylase [Geminicoccus sp.]HMU49395.1 NAD-dependent protein deacylase [Geminicoccaceae bacterium]
MSHGIVILTGAGISAESGIPTFRGADGLWEGHRLEEVATPQAFARRPELVQRFYNLRRQRLQQPDIAPNAAHLALARLEWALPGRVLVVTQNIDDLHERAGSRAVLHMHGELLKARCLGCGAVVPWLADIEEGSRCPGCGVVGRLRPHVVWFGEMPIGMAEIEEALAACELFVAIGTSGVVYPAAGFVETVRAIGRAHSIEVNLEPSAVGSAFAEHRRGRAGLLVPALVDEVMEARSGGG